VFVYRLNKQAVHIVIASISGLSDERTVPTASHKVMRLFCPQVSTKRTSEALERGLRTVIENRKCNTENVKNERNILCLLEKKREFCSLMEEEGDGSSVTHSP